MYQNDNNAGIERNVKTGSKTAVVVAVIVVILLFLLPHLSMQKIEKWMEGLSAENPRGARPNQLFTDAGKDVRKNIRIQAEKKAALAREKEARRQKAATVSKRLPLLMAAVETDNLPLIKHWVAQGNKIDVQDIDGNEALFYVTDRTSPELIAYLLEQGLDINHRNKFQNTPLMFAIRHKNVPAVRFMVEHGADEGSG